MKLIVILMFIAIDCVSGEEQRTIGKEKFELTEDVNNTRSLIPAGYGINPYSSDEGLRGKYAKDNYLDQIASSTKDVDTVEKSPSRNLSPAIETSTVKPDKAEAKDHSHRILRCVILLAMITQFITAILILAPQTDKLAEWYETMKTEPRRAETKRLQAGEKVFATGPLSKISVSTQRRADEANEKQRSSV